MRTGPDDDAERVVIRSAAGPITARLRHGLIRATGIPYAGAARWQRPVAVATGSYRATRPAPACPQLPIPRLDALLPAAFADLGFDEACLNLSVTAPAAAAGLPVMVWLHGGSYESGAGDMAVFDPAALVAEQQVVVVAVTYRLGLFGWLGGPERAANLGAQDVVAALHWVRDHIAVFGGDPGCVTLFGQSSGGDLAARLMVSDATRGLLHRVIVQSAPLALSRRTGRMRAVMRRGAEGLTAAAPIREVLECQATLRRAVRRFGLAGQMPFGPEFGADPFPSEADLAAAHAAIAAEIPLLIGHTRDEAALFLPPVGAGPGRLAEPLRRMGVRALGHRLYRRPADGFAAHHRHAGGQATRFRIDWSGGEWGAAHLAELPLLFPGPDWLGTPLVPQGMTLKALTRAGAPLRRAWADFARTGRAPDDLPGMLRIDS
ncbi:carboxylesterase family protein [Paracoccus sp. S1E-3]|uniref:carboxylesterase family protein n=1 Tax=Paracoccus sp. S1E-3 TaxID=2756130 RepID=UPI0015EF329F|nr:carboxylesterase family protein [Paracoccus sp. S1E-3]MBA4492506.1 carboxylesterase/lipase family protein [Paracoccus sp. S1E-3]